MALELGDDIPADFPSQMTRNEWLPVVTEMYDKIDGHVQTNKHFIAETNRIAILANNLRVDWGLYTVDVSIYAREFNSNLFGYDEIANVSQHEAKLNEVDIYGPPVVIITYADCVNYRKDLIVIWVNVIKAHKSKTVMLNNYFGSLLNYLNEVRADLPEVMQILKNVMETNVTVLALYTRYIKTISDLDGHLALRGGRRAFLNHVGT